MGRTSLLQVKLTTEERVALNVAAEASGETVSAYVRRAARERMQREKRAAR